MYASLINLWIAFEIMWAPFFSFSFFGGNASHFLILLYLKFELWDSAISLYLLFCIVLKTYAIQSHCSVLHLLSFLLWDIWIKSHLKKKFVYMHLDDCFSICNDKFLERRRPNGSQKRKGNSKAKMWQQTSSVSSSSSRPLYKACLR